MRLSDRVALVAFGIWVLLWFLVTGCSTYVVDDMAPVPVSAPPLAVRQTGTTVVWLDFADGVAAVPPGPLYAGLVPPAAICDDVCRGTLLAGLRARFGDLAIDFTEELPAGPHYTVVLNGGGNDWTGNPRPRVGGISPFACGGYPDGTSFVFSAGDVDDDTLAVMTAHELGHLFGLEHTLDNGTTATLMALNVNVRGQSFGSMETVDDQCGRAVQDEPKMLEQALGYRTVTP